MKKPLILISNDDGVSAKGINELIKYLSPLGELVVMAPDSPRSGNGCAITATAPVHYKLINTKPGLKIYSCSGTPTDCIKLARNTVLDREPDLVVGGINHGDNSGTSVHYSGTMGVAIEGCLSGIPSIGFSLCDHSSEADFEPCAEYIREIARMVLEHGLPKGICLNVNFPVSKEIKGMKVCEQAVGHWHKEWEPCPRSFDDKYFWLTGEFVCHDPENERSDNWALSQGYASVTPVTVDMTAYGFMEELTKRIVK